MLRTHSSSFVMSVSSSHGFTSNKMDDFAISAGITSSSSEPNRSMSSSSSLESALVAFFTPGRLYRER
uniref:Uncharacterized protein n=1 Tax=Paramormyrops kingsleyae TaxID=1676925 RepID=A0A3B3SFN9_9TELE